ncbi:copper chaperone PCu(A)C [Bordetella genomosp. 13]|uniref:copper chaperone PCu(A)C n=1 Tax=Bordetella genomosp. 13 TaxID=463040 RepID=UPI0011A2BCC4|nr:copper chaperone PCu(A)C [Bordetella genomosp. 13]
MTIRNLALAAALSMCAATAWADSYKAGQIEVDDLWVRATAPGQPNGAGYFEIENEGKTADRLVSVRSDAAERVELHNVVTENGVARMRAVDGGVEVPAGGELKFAPGGYHVMFLKVKGAFAEGKDVPATLTFEKAGDVAVKFTVKPLSYSPGAGGHAMGGHDMGGMKH